MLPGNSLNSFHKRFARATPLPDPDRSDAPLPGQGGGEDGLRASEGVGACRSFEVGLRHAVSDLGDAALCDYPQEPRSPE